MHRWRPRRHSSSSRDSPREQITPLLSVTPRVLRARGGGWASVHRRSGASAPGRIGDVARSRGVALAAATRRARPVSGPRTGSRRSPRTRRASPRGTPRLSAVASDGDAPHAAPPAWWDLGARLEARDRLEARSEMGYLAHPSEARVVWSRRSDAGNGVVRVVAHGPWRSLRFNQVEQGLTFVRPRLPRGVTASPDADRADDSLDDSLVLRSPGNAPPRATTPSRSRRRREPPRSTKRRTSIRTTGSTPPDRSAAADDAVADSDVLGYEYLRVMTAAAAAYCREVPGVDFSGLEPATTSPAARDGFGGGGGDDAIAGSRNDDTEGLRESGTRRRVVFVGLGSGAAPAFLAKKFPRARVDACEIDPAVVAAAREALGLRDVLDVVAAEGEGDDDAPAAGRVRVTVEDAASYVRRASDRAANVRATGGGSGRDASASASVGHAAGRSRSSRRRRFPPPHARVFTSTLLAPGGVLVANAFNGVAGSAPRRAAEAFAMRLAERVGPVASFSRAKSPHNVVFLARRGGGSGAERAGGDEVEEGSSGDEDAFARRRRREYYSPPRLTRRTLERNARDIGASAGFEWDAAEAVERGFWVEARSARGDGGGARALTRGRGANGSRPRRIGSGSDRRRATTRGRFRLLDAADSGSGRCGRGVGSRGRACPPIGTRTTTNRLYFRKYYFRKSMFLFFRRRWRLSAPRRRVAD